KSRALSKRRGWVGYPGRVAVVQRDPSASPQDAVAPSRAGACRVTAASVPQGLKPHSPWSFYGTAEAVPLTKPWLFVDHDGDDLAGDAGVFDVGVGDDGLHAVDFAGVEAALGVEVPGPVVDLVHVIGVEREGFGAAIEGEDEDGRIGALDFVQDSPGGVARAGGRSVGVVRIVVSGYCGCESRMRVVGNGGGDGDGRDGAASGR